MIVCHYFSLRNVFRYYCTDVEHDLELHIDLKMRPRKIFFELNVNGVATACLPCYVNFNRIYVYYIPNLRTY